MRYAPIWTMLPLILLAACQSGQTGDAPVPKGTPCPPRLQDAGQCGTSSIYVFPELTNVR
jgi:hypothetical protein